MRLAVAQVSPSLHPLFLDIDRVIVLPRVEDAGRWSPRFGNGQPIEELFYLYRYVNSAHTGNLGLQSLICYAQAEFSISPRLMWNHHEIPIDI